MSWWQQQGLRSKLAVGISLTLLIILGIAFFGASQYVRTQLWERETQVSENLNAVVATLLEDAMMAGRKDTIHEALNTLGESVGGRIDSIAVYDDQVELTAFATGFPGGRTIQQASLAVGLEDPSCWACHQYEPGDRPTWVRISLEGNDVLRNVVPLYNEPRCQTCHGTGQKVLGDSIIDIRLDRYQQTVSTVTIGLGVTITLAIIAVTLVMYQLLRQIVITPLEELVGFTQTVAEGEMQKTVPIRSDDEVGQLGKALNTMEAQLRELFLSLEHRVAERTAELQERTTYLQTSAEIGRSVTSELDQDTLIQNVVNMIRERFDFYYVGLFLIDSRQEWAVLAAGTGEAGQKMLEQNHRLEIGQGMIGWCIENAEARIALDIGKDAHHFDNPYLPETRSEAALPLRSRGRVLGALSVQSSKPDAFNQDVLNILEVMVDQIAIALDNAELIAISEAALESERRSYGELSSQAWVELLHQRPDYRYICDSKGSIQKVSDEKTTDEEIRIMEEDLISDQDTIVLPIKIREKTYGGIRLKKSRKNSHWNPNELAIVKAITEQLSIALDSARLFETTQKQAQIERVTSEMTDKIHRSLDIDALMQTLLNELTTALDVDDAFIQLGNPTDLADSSNDNPSS